MFHGHFVLLLFIMPLKGFNSTEDEAGQNKEESRVADFTFCRPQPVFCLNVLTLSFAGNFAFSNILLGNG